MNLDKFLNKLAWFFGASKIINNFPDGILFVNKEGYITQMNKRAGELLLVSDGTNTLLLSDFLKEGLEVVKFSAKSKRAVLTEINVGGHCFYAELFASKIKKGYCVSLRDSTTLTNEQETEIKINKFNNEKNAMLVKIEPEISSHIESIRGFSKGLIDGLGGELSEKQAKYVKIVNNNAVDLSNFMKNLFEFSECESSLYKPEYEKFDIVALIKEVIKEFENKFDEKKVGFTFDYDLIDDRFIFADIKGFKKIITNIFSASFDMTENGNISLRLSPVDEETSLGFGLDENQKYMQITLRDTGTGLEVNELKTLCDPYFQADKGKKNLSRALMLGSASILVKRSNGFIDISSELMRGTIYNIVIPVEKEKNE